MQKGRYYGLIKDCDGGTPMECYIHPSIDFTNINDMLKIQKQYILNRIKLYSNSHIIYEPLTDNSYIPNLEGISRAKLCHLSNESDCHLLVSMRCISSRACLFICIILFL